MPNIFDQLAAEQQQQPRTSANIFDQLASEAKASVPAGTPGGVLPGVPGAPVPLALQHPPVVAPQSAGGWRDRLSARISSPSMAPDKGAAGQVEKFGQGTAEGLTSPVLHPVSTAESLGSQLLAGGASGSAMGIPGMAMTGNPTIDAQNEEARSGLRADAAEQGQQMVANPANTAGQIAGGAILSHVVGGAVQGVKNATTAPMNLPGENFNPYQHRALSGVLARGTAMGKDFIAPDVARDIASPLRQAAADAPAKVQAVMQGTPQDALGATQSLLKDAQTKIDAQHQMALQPVANTPVDMTPVQDAIPDPKAFHDDTERAAIQNLRDRVDKVRTLGDLNDFRQYLGEENSSTFGKNTVAANNGSVAAKALNAADAAARDHYYDQLEQATGLDFQPLKRTESSVLKAQQALGNVGPSLVNKYALASEPRGPGSTAADILQGSKALGGGLPLVSYAAEKLRPAPIEQVQSSLRNVFSNLPEPSNYRGPLTSRWSPAPRGLPANVPSNAPFGAPSQAAGSAGPVPQPTITPAPSQLRQLPSQAGPEGQGIPAALPSNPPPPLNLPTARTNVNAGTPRPAQEAIPQRTIAVSPEGQAAIQRPALPAPETHAWSRSTWQKAHPKGNLKTAEKAAAGKGYRIID
jgi:hypothetical protein